MNRTQNYIFVSLISVLLFACQTEAPLQPPTVAKAEPVLTTPHPASTTAQTSTPSKTASPPPTNTPTPSKISNQPDVRAMEEGTCIPGNTSVSVSTEIFQQTDFENAIAIFLNQGGAPEELVKQLGSNESASEPNLIQVLQPDINSDGIPDVLITITLHQFDGYGETHILSYICREGQYESTILFRRAGAGSRAEGLYAGGGARIESLDDLNQDGSIEILFSVNWPEYAEYYLLRWDSGQFTSLIEYIDMLGNIRYSFDVEPGKVKVEDVDGDGIYEIVVTAMDYQTMLEETNYWFWDGEKYSLPSE